MKKLIIQLDRELKAIFYSPVAYVVLCFFLFLTGAVFYVTINLMNHRPVQVTVLEAFFNTVLFWFAYVLVSPLITMRLFAEEFKMGTIEPLMTAPVRDWQVVLAKFLAALIFYIILWIPSLFYFVIFQWVSNEPVASASGAFFGSYLLMLLMGMFYVSLGCLASVLTRNQIIAAVISFCAIVLFFFSGLLSIIVPNVSPFLRDLVAYFSAIEHMRQFSVGIIDSRAIVYYLTMTGLTLYLTFQVFQFRKWRV